MRKLGVWVMMMGLMVGKVYAGEVNEVHIPVEKVASSGMGESLGHYVPYMVKVGNEFSILLKMVQETGTPLYGAFNGLCEGSNRVVVGDRSYGVLGLGLGERPYTGQFKDIEGHWAESAIQEVYEMSLMGGVSDNQFNPKGKVTVKDAVVVLNRLGLRNYGSMGVVSSRSEVENLLSGTEGHWAYTDMANYLQSYPLEHVKYWRKGTGLGWYSHEITRGELAWMMYGLYDDAVGYVVGSYASAGLNPYDLGSRGTVVVPEIKDVEKGIAYEVIADAVGAGYLSLDSDGCFYPDRGLTRAELVMVVKRMDEMIKGIKDNTVRTIGQK